MWTVTFRTQMADGQWTEEVRDVLDLAPDFLVPIAESIPDVPQPGMSRSFRVINRTRHYYIESVRSMAWEATAVYHHTDGDDATELMRPVPRPTPRHPRVPRGGWPVPRTATAVSQVADLINPILRDHLLTRLQTDMARDSAFYHHFVNGSTIRYEGREVEAPLSYERPRPLDVVNASAEPLSLNTPATFRFWQGAEREVVVDETRTLDSEMWRQMFARCHPIPHRGDDSQ